MVNENHRGYFQDLRATVRVRMTTQPPRAAKWFLTPFSCPPFSCLDIHIEYPTPNGFLDLYSDGIGKIWVGDFGKLRDNLRALRQIERRGYLNVS
jgi:hypothetical protein